MQCVAFEVDKHVEPLQEIVADHSIDVLLALHPGGKCRECSCDLRHYERADDNFVKKHVLQLSASAIRACYVRNGKRLLCAKEPMLVYERRVQVDDAVRAGVYFKRKVMKYSVNPNRQLDEWYVVFVDEGNLYSMPEIVNFQGLFGIAIYFEVIVIDFDVECGQPVQTENAVPILGWIGDMRTSGFVIVDCAYIDRVVVAVFDVVFAGRS